MAENTERLKVSIDVRIISFLKAKEVITIAIYDAEYRQVCTKPHEVGQTGGQIIFVEYRANDRKVPIKPLHTMTVDHVRKKAEDIELRLDRADSSLPWQHMIFFSNA